MTTKELSVYLKAKHDNEFYFFVSSDGEYKSKELEEFGIKYHSWSKDSNYERQYLRFTFEGKTYQLSGSYSSYGGGEYSDIFNFYEVKEEEKTIKVYTIV